MEATASRMRAAFAEVARGLMEWEDPPAITDIPSAIAWGAHRRAQEQFYRPRGKQETPEYVEPFDVQADWDERS